MARIWDINGRTVSVVGDKNFHVMENGTSSLLPIGFPIDDVFEYDEGVASGDTSSGKLRNIL